MKKIILSTLTLCTVISMSFITKSTYAIDFEKHESKYIKLCSSSSLTSSNKKTCEEFNKYLSKKNNQIKEDIKESKKELGKTNNDIKDLSLEIKDTTKQISEKKVEINYLLNSINKIEKNIKKKEKLMQDRLYIMQSQYNSNQLINFIFGSENFSDFFSRIASVSNITSYESELVETLTKAKKELNQNKQSLLNAKKLLEAQQNEKIVMQDRLVDLKIKKENEIKKGQADSHKISQHQKKIDAALSSLMEHAPSGGGGGGSYVPGSSTVGNAIAQKALSKRGARYWWGAPGGGFGDGQGLDNPNAMYFDCSGLVAWAHRQAGVKIGRTSAAGYSRSGKAVTRSQLQPGDIITFSYGSGVSHIGIYIGGGSFVHAAGSGSGTRGQYADQCVKVAKLAGYWEGHVHNYRRLY